MYKFTTITFFYLYIYVYENILHKHKSHFKIKIFCFLRVCFECNCKRSLIKSIGHVKRLVHFSGIVAQCSVFERIEGNRIECIRMYPTTLLSVYPRTFGIFFLIVVAISEECHIDALQQQFKLIIAMFQLKTDISGVIVAQKRFMEWLEKGLKK